MRPRHGPQWTLAQVGRYLNLAEDQLPETGQQQERVRGISLNTSAVEHGDLYAALPGSRAHGARFIDRARELGASAALTDPEGAAEIAGRLPTLVHPHPRQVLAGLAASFYDHPTRDVNTFGITGTQGKTTATYLAEAALGAEQSAVIGTVGTRIAGAPAATVLTTPESPALQALFAVMREERISTCAMEVSSHALVQGRVDGIRFGVAAFLNLGRDHLDFHHSIDEYFQAKALLFTADRTSAAVINHDDEYGRRLTQQTTVPVTTFSVNDSEADWYSTDLAAGSNGSQMLLHGPGGVLTQLSVPLPGVFNVSNAIAVIASLTAIGYEPHELAAGIAGMSGVPGRLERIDRGQCFAAFVDYAHKPDAVTAVLAALRPLTRGRLIIVLGAGGERDPGKRPQMGAAAAHNADVVVVTDDNPRSEDPEAIREAIIGGCQAHIGGCQARTQVIDVPGRRDAIASAVAEAGEGDTLIVAGKGHETGQQIGDVIHPFDDRQVLAELIESAP